MPWTFGGFTTTEDTKYDIHKFMALSDKQFSFGNGRGFVNLYAEDKEPGFDNNNTIDGGDYTLKDDGEMVWKYNTPNYGKLKVSFEMTIFYDYKLDMNSDMRLNVHWFKNGEKINETHIRDDKAPVAGFTQGADTVTIWQDVEVNEGETVSCKVYLRVHKAKSSTVARCYLRILEYKNASIRIPIGGEINFDSYIAMQKINFLNFLKGSIDMFNLSVQTDTIKKEILIEPSHQCDVSGEFIQGYFNKKKVDWTDKEDISKETTIEIYSDNARQFHFKFKDDNNDGSLKTVQDRNNTVLGSGKYLFNERFKDDKKEFENRFFSPTMHYNVDEFSGITGITPQMIAIVPENISNTSSKESQNTFSPKVAYYKGLCYGVGGWRYNGEEHKEYPYLFAVNYKNGGQNDPILSYSDERIGDNDSDYVIGKGLLRKFFWQRLAIMNNGQWITTNIRLNNFDVVNWYHREHIIIGGEIWELISIKNHSPLGNKSTQCTLRKFIHISKYEKDNTYPSENSILKGKLNNNFDTQYNKLLCLHTDIPRH